MQARSYDNYIKNVIGASLTEVTTRRNSGLSSGSTSLKTLGVPVLISPKGLHITDLDKAEALNT